MTKVLFTHTDDQDQFRSVAMLTSNHSKLERHVSKLILLVEAQQIPGFPTRSQDI